MEEVAKVIRGVVPSLSLNDGDLTAITSFEGTEFFRAPKPNAATTETLYRRYERAVHLADKLRLQELWVHGNDADILLVKVAHEQLVSGVLRRVIAHKMNADLLAKGIVVLALLQRSLSTMWRKSAKRLSPTLAAKGFKALFDLAWDYSEKVCPDDLEKRMEVFRQVVMQGYHYRRKGGGYALIVIPVMWPREADLPAGVDPTGLGDMYSAIVSVF